MTLSAYPTTSAISSPGRQNLPQSSCFSTTTVTKPGGSVQLLSKTRWLCSFQIIQVIRSTMESKPLRRSPGMHILLMSHQSTKWYTSGTFMVESKLNQILRMIWKERNHRVFDNSCTLPPGLVTVVVEKQLD